MRAKLDRKPKDYGIMVLFVPHKPPCGTYSVSFWFPALPALFICFLFSGFSFGKMICEAKRSNPQLETREANVTKFQTFKTGTIMNITGRLTKDAEVRTTSTGKQVVNFSVAVNDSYKNKQGERIEQTAYFDCSYWRTPNVVKMLTKGLLVELTGRVSARAWVSKNGEPMAGLNFHTSDIKPLAGGKRAEMSQPSTQSKSDVTTDDLPF